jgi:diaminohydroxyphosphoribosylaminopyrimidine deaminase/5-amino-6-(5-phosphoribosylamino)uracil reductase
MPPAAAGIAVEVGEGAGERAEINAGFLLRVREGRPLFHLKIATVARRAHRHGVGREQMDHRRGGARRRPALRAIHDAILVGAEHGRGGRSRADLPPAGLERYSPVAIVLDSKRGLSPGSKLARRANGLRYGCSARAAPGAGAEALQARASR